MTYDSCTLTKTGNIILPRARLYYPALFTPQLPQGETDQSKAKYQLSLLVPKKADMKLVINRVEEVIGENLTPEKRKNTKVKKPFLKTEEQPRIAEYAEDFPVLLRMNSKQRPGVVDAQGNPVVDESEVYSGRWARVSVRVYWYDHPTGGKGVSLGLQNVQILENDEVLAGGRVRAEDEFEPVAIQNTSDIFA